MTWIFLFFFFSTSRKDEVNKQDEEKKKKKRRSRETKEDELGDQELQELPGWRASPGDPAFHPSRGYAGLLRPINHGGSK